MSAVDRITVIASAPRVIVEPGTVPSLAAPEECPIPGWTLFDLDTATASGDASSIVASRVGNTITLQNPTAATTHPGLGAWWTAPLVDYEGATVTRELLYMPVIARAIAATLPDDVEIACGFVSQSSLSAGTPAGYGVGVRRAGADYYVQVYTWTGGTPPIAGESGSGSSTTRGAEGSAGTWGASLRAAAVFSLTAGGSLDLSVNRAVNLNNSFNALTTDWYRWASVRWYAGSGSPGSVELGAYTFCPPALTGGIPA